MAFAALALAASASAQWVATPPQAFANSSAAFRERYPAGTRLLEAGSFGRNVAFESLLNQGSAAADDALAQQFAGHLRKGDVRFTVSASDAAPAFTKLVPEVAAMLDWSQGFRSAVLGVLATPGLTAAERDGRMTEVVAQYRQRDDAAVSAIPKGLDILDARPHSLEFRRRFPVTNALGWATRWGQAALYESLVADSTPRGADAAIRSRLLRMIGEPADSAPYLLPIAPGVAPAFARRYPDAAAIIDNLNMFEDGIADILVAREIPRSAKRLELLRLRDVFRDDTAGAITIAQWMSSVEMIGVNNMGGPTVGFSQSLATPSVSRGASMVGMSTHDMSTMGQPPAASEHAGHTATPAAQPTLEALLAIHARMMSDPVIRERVATDPALQKMLQAAGLDSSSDGGGMPGMDHANMPGMSMTPATAAKMLAGTPEQRAQAVDFIVRLLSDPAVEARIHTSAELHTLWSDPEVQKRLAELKRRPPTKPPQ